MKLLTVFFLIFFIIPLIAATPSQPSFYAIVVGISDYSGDGIDLKYSAKDAESVAKTFRICAGRLFGEKTFIYLLASGKENIPTKRNIAKVFAEVTGKIKKEDVLLIYLAGHGIITDGVEGSYCYLTSDARSFAGLDDPAVRKITAITISELKDWVSNMTVEKKAIIMDTCAAGNAAENLSGKKDIPGQKDVLRKLAEQRGLYILMGCAANARSYEAGKYGQGLLTYALLQGIKGASLEKGNVVDVSKLFNYASERVPELASDIGGVQKPLISVSHGVSFAIGMLTEEDKANIPLESEKELTVQPVFMNPEIIGDPMRLTQTLTDKLKKLTSIVYIDAEKYPNALLITGFYTVKNAVITAEIKIFRNDKLINEYCITAEENKVNKLADDIITEFVNKVIRK